MGFVTTTEKYTLTGEPTWVDFAGPSFHRPAAPQQHDLDVLNLRCGFQHLPKSGERSTGDKQGPHVGGAENISSGKGRCRTCCLYSHRPSHGNSGKPIATVRETISWRKGGGGTGMGQAMEPQQTNQKHIFKMEELYVQAVIAKVPYTQAQLTDQALVKIKKTGISTNNVVTLNAHPDYKKT